MRKSGRQTPFPFLLCIAKYCVHALALLTTMLKPIPALGLRLLTPPAHAQGLIYTLAFAHIFLTPLAFPGHAKAPGCVSAGRSPA